MRVDDHRFYTSLTDSTLLEAALVDLPIALAAHLPESTMLSISYGWGCQIHAALQHIRMEVLVSNLGEFVGESLRQGIVVPGDSDLHIEVPKGRLWLTFDHEGYVFSHGSDYELETEAGCHPRSVDFH